ncbi:IPTL-CTERM sorting domain-containing protein [Ottowia testudinis]|uniref:IPTL-CTERM sorting domain-containing protein n=1 Tax=Ottowia testudinis TaxID=2816950 RepID=A0A975CFM6_9BURK|nr:IPTL-CTERM sorting domain-containing protein [Ottowia testudinis]QTD43972.1 IPTL-CTERM sorting domain-containing protein [Ottowia testudinis]
MANGTFAINPAASSATPNSGQPITYSSLTTGVCTVSGTTVTMLAAGTCTLAADQAAGTDTNGDSYMAAAQVTQNVTITNNPGGVAAVPTLGEWGLMLLGLLAAALGVRGLRRQA